MVQRLIIVTLALFPFLLYCFARTFARTPRWLDAAAVALTAVAGLGTFAFRHLPAQGEAWPAGYGVWVAEFLGQWTLLSAVVAARLWRAGAGQPTVSRRRMRTLSLGTIGLAVALIVAGTAPGNGKASVAQIVTQVLAVLSGPLFLTGFAPPRALLASWRRPELDELQAAEAALVAAQTPEEVGARLVPHLVRIIGGRGALLLDGDRKVVGSYGLNATDVAEIAGQNPEADVVDRSLMRIPLSAGQLVVVATPYTPYFARDETGLISNLGTLTDLALSRVRLAARERQVATELPRRQRGHAGLCRYRVP